MSSVLVSFWNIDVEFIILFWFRLACTKARTLPCWPYLALDESFPNVFLPISSFSSLPSPLLLALPLLLMLLSVIFCLLYTVVRLIFLLRCQLPYSLHKTFLTNSCLAWLFCQFVANDNEEFHSTTQFSPHTHTTTTAQQRQLLLPWRTHL